MAAHNSRTVRDLRRENRTAVLRRLFFDGPMSRFSLAPATGLSSGSISNVVTELLAEGLVEEAGSVDSDGGRPRTLLRIAPRSGHMIGVDVGETRVRVELFDLSLAEQGRAERPLPTRGTARPDRYDSELIAGHIRDGIAEVVEVAGLSPAQILGVGIGTPGIIEHSEEDGAVVHCTPIGWEAVPLERMLRRPGHLPQQVPYFIENGAKTLGQAEMWFGAGRGARSAVVVLFGSGVGACVVTDDVEHGRAVEWGHLTVRVRGRRCRCGALGCLEAYAGAEALLERWQEAGGQPPPDTDEETALTAMLAGAYPPDAANPTDRANPTAGADGGAPDPVAAAVLAETAEYLGAGLSDLINLFQPERILVGGWAGLQLGSRFLESVRRHALSYALPYPSGRVGIDLGALGPDAVTVGAATLPLADFFARGGRRLPTPPAPEPSPGWRTSLGTRLV
ncbi:ROK family protein [Streptomyces sp. NPDC059679]|uniref:ROK family transcriptional regulator n=1 Tax=Streptomyces sp. NPDC059679 TaxID=3346903 RepID=UPI0036A35D64